PGTRSWFAHDQIDAVAATRRWMRDYGKLRFRPTRPETRERFARAVVRAFASDETATPGQTFIDLPTTDRFYPYANVAVSNGWMTAKHGAFDPAGPVYEYDVSRALVYALGLRRDARGANHIHMDDGTRLRRPGHFGVYLIGRVLGLW